MRITYPIQPPTGRIFYFGEGAYKADLFLPVALAMRRLCPNIESRFIDMSETIRGQAPKLASGVSRFLEMGFEGEDFSLQIAKSNMYERSRMLLAIQATLVKLKPMAVVVPHEYGYAFDVVQVSNLLGIPTYHLQHAVWPADVLGGEPMLTSARRWDEPGSQTPKLATRASGIATQQAQILRNQYALMKLLALAVARSLFILRSSKKRGELPPNLQLLLSQHSSNYLYRCSVKKVGAAGPYYKKRFEALGIPEEGVDIVGFTRTDWFLTQPLESKEVLCARYNIDPNLPLALYMYASLAPLLENRDAIDAISDAICALRRVNPDISVLVLVHPQGDISRVVSAVKSLKLKGIQVSQAHRDHYSLYRAADLILGVHSSTLAEATLAGRPIVTQNYVLYDVAQSQLIEGGAVVPVFHCIHLQDQIERALKDRPFVERLIANQADIAYDLMGPFDGKCGERAARSILHLAGIRVSGGN